jgi:hypothetical protein
MSRVSNAGIGLVAVLAIGAVTSVGAWASSGPVWAYCAKALPKNTGAYADKSCTAAAPGSTGRYELVDGIGKGKGFKGKTQGLFRIYGVVPPGEFKMECQDGKISGSVLAPNKVTGVVISLSKCRTNISDEVKSCVLVTSPLAGELGWINQAKGEAGLKLTSQAEPETGLIGEAAGCIPEVKERWRGSAIAAWGPVGTISKVSTIGYQKLSFFEEANPRFDESSNPLAFEGEEGIHILRSEINDPENGFEWSTKRGNAAAFEGAFSDKGEALMVH